MNRTKQGMNRTGMKTAPIQAPKMLEVTKLTVPTSKGDKSLLAATRIEVSGESVDGIGTMPPPGSVKELANTAAKMLTGKKAPVFMDKLGERLAFERSGVRLYDAALSKFDAYGSWKGGPSRADLQHIREEELRHFLMLRECMQELGGDPTAMTPSADVHASASEGILKVCADARTNLQQTLEALSIAELADNDCWENLIDLAMVLGREDLATRFQEALDNEREHLRNIRLWLGAVLSQDVSGKLAQPFAQRAVQRNIAISQRGEVPAPVKAKAGRVVSRATARSSVKTKAGRMVRGTASAKLGRATNRKRG